MGTNELAALLGAALGVFFFGGLWWTVRALVASARPGLLQFSSLMLRMAVTLGGFYLAGGGKPGRLLACLAGFLAARVAVAFYVRRIPEASHAARP